MSDRPNWANLGKDVPMDALPFSKKRQDALLGHLILQETLYRLCKGRLLPAWFGNPHSQQVWAAVLAFEEKYKRRPTAEEISESPSVMPEDPQTKNKLRAHISSCLNDSQFVGLDVVHRELTEWLHARMYQQTFEKSYQQYKAQNLYGAIDTMREGFRNVEEIRFVQDEEMDFEAHGARFEETKAELTNAVTTGSEMLDHILNPDATEGALLRGDATCLLAPSNAGKTRCIITIARHNVMKREKHVLYLTHEGRKKNIEELLFCSFLSSAPAKRFYRPKDLYQLYATEHGRAILAETAKVMKAHLCYMPMARAGLTVEEVAASIRRKQDQWRATHNGRGFDLILDDYPGKLTTAVGAKGNLQKRNIDDIVSDYFVQLAAELDVHVLFAFQTNREGSKISKGRSRDHAKRLLDMEDVEESWGPMKNVTNVLTLNRDAAAKERKVVTINIAKSRSSETGMAVICGSEYGSCITHDDALGVTAYRGTSVQSDMAESLLRDWAGQTIPSEALRRETD